MLRLYPFKSISGKVKGCPFEAFGGGKRLKGELRNAAKINYQCSVDAPSHKTLVRLIRATLDLPDNQRQKQRPREKKQTSVWMDLCNGACWDGNGTIGIQSKSYLTFTFSGTSGGMS